MTIRTLLGIASVLLILVSPAGVAIASSTHHKRPAVAKHGSHTHKSKHHNHHKRTKPKHKKPLVKAVIPAAKPPSPGTAAPLTPSLTPVISPTAPAATPPNVPGSPPPPPPNPDRGSSLAPNDTLTVGQYLVSNDAHYQLTMEATGDLVLTVNGRQLWHSNTAGNPGAWLVEQSDGNLVIYPAGEAANALWNAGTQNNAGASAVLGLDGNLVVDSSDGQTLWRSGNFNPNLEQNETLTPSQYLETSDGHYWLAMQSDGNLVEYVDGRPLWASGTEGNPGAWVAMQSDGNLVIYPPGNNTNALWASNTGGNPGSHLGLQVDANMVIYSASEAAIWETSVHNPNLEQNETLTTSQYVESSNGTYWAAMQSDGNFVLYGPSGAMWASSTEGHPGAWIAMQSDGNLVIYPPGNNTNALWASNTGGNPGTHLGLGTDGNLVLYNASGTAIWATNTEPHSGGGGNETPTNDYPSNLASAPKDSVVDPWGFYNRECVSFVAWRMNRDGGAGTFTNGMRGGHWGNADEWAQNAQRLGIAVNTTPTVGSVAQWDANEQSQGFTAGSAGHVAYVYAVNGDGTVDVEEYNAADTGQYSTAQNIRAPRYIHIVH
jgi:surface antigen